MTSTPQFPVKPILEEIERRAQAKGLTLTALAREAKLGGTTLTSHKSKEAGFSMRTLTKVAARLDCAVKDLLRDGAPGAPSAGGAARKILLRRPARALRKDLPLYGTAAGAIMGGFEISDTAIDYIDRPASLEGADDAYAIYVAGDSMVPRHLRGELCFVHPHRPYKSGDSVIIRVQMRVGGPVEAFIKTFVEETPEKIVAAQFNPKAKVEYKRSTVVAIHKVLTVNELFGV